MKRSFTTRIACFSILMSTLLFSDTLFATKLSTTTKTKSIDTHHSTTLQNNIMDPKVNFSTSELILNEQDPANIMTTCQGYRDILIPITISQSPTANVNVVIRVDPASTATEFSDYALIPYGLIFEPGGPTQKNLIFTVLDDDFNEGLESVILNIDAGINTGVDSELTINLVDNDFVPNFNGQSSPKRIGIGDTTNDDAIFSGNSTDNKTQILIRANELVQEGLLPGPITTLSVEVADLMSNIPYSDFTIQMKNVPQTQFDRDTFVEVQDQYWSDSYTPISGWNTFTLDTPFDWDGTSSILIQTCYSNIPFNQDDVLTATATSFNSLLVKQEDVGRPGCTLTDPDIFNVRPDIRFEQNIITPVASTTADSSYQWIESGQEVYFYSQNQNLLASIRYFGGDGSQCVNVTIKESGSGTRMLNWLGGDVTDKIFKIEPEGSLFYTLTLYYNSSELSTWGADSLSLNALVTDGSLINSDGSDADLIEANQITATYIPVADVISYSFITSGSLEIALTDEAAVPLPVDWLFFEVEKRDEDHLVSWSTASELNNAGFEIQRSFDGKHFESIGKQVASSNGIAGANYQFTDQDIVKNGKYYYRILQIDLDGTGYYSPIRIVNRNDANSGFSAWPNPAREQFSISYTTSNSIPYTINLFDINGRFIRNVVQGESNDIERSFDINSWNLSDGVYYLKLSREDGTTNIQKLVVQ